MIQAKDQLFGLGKDHPPLVVHAMTRGVVQIPGDLSVLEAARLLRKEHVPCLLVKDTERRTGILSHTDIVYKVVVKGLHPNEVEARTIMSLPVQTIEFDQSIESAATIMASKGVPLLVVTKATRPIGVLTARDLVFSPTQRESRITASMKTHEAKDDATQVATITQLNHLGAFVETPTPLPPETALSLNFYLPGSSRPIVAQATVISSRRPARRSSDAPGDGPRSSPPGMELRFSRISAPDQSQIASWIIRTSYKQSGEQ